jgi:hypothetical protein
MRAVEALVGLSLALVAALVALASPVAALFALARANQAIRRLEALEARLASPAAARQEMGAAPASAHGAEARRPAPPEAAVEPSTQAQAPPSAAAVTSPRLSGPPVAAAEAPHRAPAASTRRPARPRSEASFAASLGPKILVAAGGLAVVVFLALFVRYAWENDWVGPVGRVLSGLAFSLGLTVAGLRLMGRRYRPLGQGLAATGFSGLYVTGWAAHAVYGLVERTATSGLLVLVVVAAVAIAARENARLLAGLAWIGAYLAPVLLSTGEDRGETLLVYLALFASGALWLDRRKSWPEVPLVAAVGTAVLYAAWHEAHFTPERLVVAAPGVVGLAAVFALGPARRGVVAGLFAILSVGWLGMAAAVMAHDADRPLGLLAVLAFLALLAFLSAPRSPWTQALAALLSALTVLVWYDRWYASGGEPLALALGLGASAAHVGLLLAGRLRAQPFGLPGVLAHVIASFLAYFTLTVLPFGAGQRFAWVTALFLVHLLLGLEARRRLDLVRARTTLGLAATFLTLALPVRLGLHGTTVGWAAEGVLLLWLGVKQRSGLARGFGYAVLALAVCRLILRHLPLHEQGFTPVLNASFATWLLVIAALGIARRLSRSVGEGEIAWLDGAAALLLGPLALVLLLGVATAETDASFDQAARSAREAGDFAAALRAEREGGLAISVLWTLFATALLSAGLGLRSLPLFYASYALFALTAAKVVLVDVATLPTLYRMLSFLALGALLLAGAWLNLRFRERLLGAPREGAV